MMRRLSIHDGELRCSFLGANRMFTSGTCCVDIDDRSYGACTVGKKGYVQSG